MWGGGEDAPAEFGLAMACETLLMGCRACIAHCTKLDTQNYETNNAQKRNKQYRKRGKNAIVFFCNRLRQFGPLLVDLLQYILMHNEDTFAWSEAQVHKHGIVQWCTPPCGPPACWTAGYRLGRSPPPASRVGPVAARCSGLAPVITHESLDG